MNLKDISHILLLVLVAAMLSCSQPKATGQNDGKDSVFTESSLLSSKFINGCRVITIANPWNGGTLHCYALVPDSAKVPGNLPSGCTVVRTPIKHAVVYSAVHTSVFKELDSFDAIAGITDLQYYSDPAVVAHVKSGKITDCGQSMSPSTEKIINAHADAILLSPYQDSNFESYKRLGMPVIECADYMENSPLGRAEWIKFIGMLLGKETQADSIFNGVKRKYASLKQTCAVQNAKHPRVLTEMLYSGVWSVPGGQSYMAQVIKDAGGIYPWADDKSTGSLDLDFDRVLAKAQDADVWLIKSFGINSYADIEAANPLYTNFAAFKNRKIYVCDTNDTHIFERFPFHPELLLSDYCNIFSGNNVTLNFFRPCK